MSDEIKPSIRSIADKIKEGASVENGVVTTTKETFENTLPEDVTMDEVKKVFGHVEQLVPALELATGELGEKELKKNKELDRLTSSVKIPGHGQATGEYNRVKHYPRGMNDKTPVPHYGKSNSNVRLFATNNSGQTKTVRKTLAERAEKLFK